MQVSQRRIEGSFTTTPRGVQAGLRCRPPSEHIRFSFGHFVGVERPEDPALDDEVGEPFQLASR